MVRTSAGKRCWVHQEQVAEADADESIKENRQEEENVLETAKL